MAALDNPAASALASSDASRTRSLERSLRLLEDEHHHEKERKAELERTVEKCTLSTQVALGDAQCG